jgi:hypothetical protein
MISLQSLYSHKIKYQFFYMRKDLAISRRRILGFGATTCERNSRLLHQLDPHTKTMLLEHLLSVVCLTQASSDGRRRMTTMYYRERRCFQSYGIILFVRVSCRFIE